MNPAAKILLGYLLVFTHCLRPLMAEELELPDCSDCPVNDERTVLDVSHSYVSEQFDALARWIDGFFGTRRTDAEAAHSFVRLRNEQVFAESGEANARLRLRGNISLPLLNERLKLVFFDEDDELISGESLEDTELESDNSGGVGLQYNVAERRKFRLDYRLGLRSGDQVRTGIRMRYALPLGERSQVRLTENIYWQDTRGFGSKTIVEIERLLNAYQLVRLSNRFDFTEATVGVPWASVLSLRHAFKRDHAVAYYVRAEGQTRPDYITTAYGPGLLYRINIWKKWFFLEFEPTYLWTRLPESKKHEGIASATFRFEIMFSAEHRE
ncbi:MAG: hypothetical protein WBN40_03155 [Pseudomonadales bacterium]